ncbi:MAG: type 1 glutamine amidotransferase [Pseudomonadota bacterium]
MRVLVNMHVDYEGPGTLGTFLESAGARIQTVRLHRGESLPQDPLAYHAVVSMGGPMNVYEEETYPFLKSETDFLRQAVHAGVPTMGICLGAQMIAKAAGARVDLSAVEEIGWGKIRLTPDGTEDALFRGLPDTLDVLQWHSDVFNVPQGGTLLAGSDLCPHQAFRYRNAYGLQFHVEVTSQILTDWFSDNQTVDLSGILEKYNAIRAGLDTNAQALYRNFWSVVQEYATDKNV